MKFHCDRCKTRYSIADERVSGKILKIRCKNCSAVITVREGMAPAPAGPLGASKSGPAAAARPGAGSKSGPAGLARSRGASAAVARSKPESKSGPAARRMAQPASQARRGQSKTGGAGAKGSALRGAFQDVMARPEPSASDSFHAAPAMLEQEWYVSIDGDQTGPLSLADACQWVGNRDADDELYCWNDSLDDWLPIEKVSHFRGLRAPTAVSPLRASTVPPPPPPSRPSSGARGSAAAGSAQQPRAATPRPLFEATLNRVTAEAAADASEPHPTNGTARTAPKDMFAEVDSEPADLDFDIGEASRVVKLPMLMRVPEGDAQPFDSDAAGLPGVAKLGKGTGSQPPLAMAAALARGATGAVPTLGSLSDSALADATPDILAASKPRSHVLELAVGGGILIALSVAIAFFALRSANDVPEDKSPRIRADVYVEDLGTPFAAPTPGATAAAKSTGAVADNAVAKTDPARSGTRNSRPPRRATTKTGATRRAGSSTNGAKRPVLASSTGKTETVPGTDTAAPALSELTGMDVSRVARRYRMSTQRCYERALKKDPFLSVSKINIVLSVAPSGVVSNISMSSHKASLLGTCLNRRIRAWAFPKSNKGIKTQVTVAFQRR